MFRSRGKNTSNHVLRGPHAGLSVRQRGHTCHHNHQNCRGATTKPHAERSSWATQGPAGVPLPLSSDEDDEAMDFLNSRKRLREESGDEDDHAPRKQTATTSPDEESHASQGSEEMSGSEFRTVMNSEGASSTGDMTTSAPTGGRTQRAWMVQALTNTHYRLNSRPTACNNRISRNPPSDASAAMEVVEEVPLVPLQGATSERKPLIRRRTFCSHRQQGPLIPTAERRGRSQPRSDPRLLHRRAQLPTFPNLSARPPQQWTHQGSTAVRWGVPQTQRASRWSPPKAPDAVPGTLLLLRPSRSTRPLWAQFCSGRQPRRVLEQLLNIKELKGIPVTAKEPADHKTSTGFLHGVDGEPAVDSLLPGIKSAVPVLSAAREGRTVTLRFAGPVPPEHVSLLGPFPSAASQTPPSAVPAMRSVRPCEGELQLARQLHQMRPDPPWRELQADPVCELRGPSLCRPQSPSVAGAAEDCHNHGILPNNPLEAHSGSSGARGD
ncbi:hypothetical protein HPB51_028936 [Rhipicephalus microplus]|uniref:Uncharacterized protein n=1 Tax=Rhipicephalus microplus TaxID=6941 RepID=A0A9J6CWE1_RHIMP|nr:hypothetical protein HPB51_028936 [Rhipicephalus microplus]